MRLDLLLSALGVCAVSSAVPVQQEYPVVPMPTPTKPLIQSASAASQASSSASPSASMAPVGPYSCPQNQHKQCCMSLADTSRDAVIKPLGELVPIVGGIQISSAISFQCKTMQESEAPDSCNEPEFRPMCCSNSNTGSSVNSCKPFEKAKEEYYRTFGYGKGVEDPTDVIMDAVS
ncbi:hypothetical protein PENSTE_c015G10401 [Penicillium steckii]|uniref:Hydrophobin n=1 Tax=Penicillium steckii TaxID=303698 RepID=A0A1V6SZU2_9EURO|nr:hypothetical protein PENSTE_c015G10401 [Penicillium steckii]